jgi:hypothetical protein
MSGTVGKIALDAVVVDVIELRGFLKEVQEACPPPDDVPETNIKE